VNMPLTSASPGSVTVPLVCLGAPGGRKVLGAGAGLMWYVVLCAERERREGGRDDDSERGDGGT